MRWFLQATLVAVAAAAAVADPSPAVIERWFSTGLYPWIQRALTPTTNLVPFAVLDILVVAGVAVVLFVLVRAVRTAWRQRRARPLILGIWRLVLASAAVYLVFLLLWGLNYRRVAMTDRLVLDRGAPSAEAVLSLGLESVERLNALHAEAHRTGWEGDAWREPSLRDAFAFVQSRLADAPQAVPGRLKRTMFGPYFRWTSVDGMVNPFGLEVLGNPDLLPFERPFVVAHEWAHLAGYAQESEANFVGWLACLQAGVPAQYSGWLFLYWQLYAEVGGEDRVTLNATLGSGPRADLAAVTERVRRGQLPWLRTAGWQVYDQYLRANRVPGGLRSYSEVVTLLLRARFEDGWTPVRRSSSTP